MNKAKLGRALVAFAAVTTLADLLAHNHKFVGLLALTIATLLGGGFLSRAAWRRIFGAMLLLSIAIAGIAVVQLETMPRPHGPFASANFLGGYAMLHVFIALFLARRCWVWWLYAAANGATLWLSQSRGAILACAVGVAIILLRTGWRALLALIGAASAVLAYVWMAEWEARPALFDDPRFSIWRMGWMGAREKLVIGWGQEGFSLTGGFAHYYNSALDCLIAAGVIGLGCAAWMLLAALRQTSRIGDPNERLALLGLIAAWCVNGLFIYDRAETVIPLYAVLGYLMSLDNNKADAAGRIDDRQASRRDRARTRAAIRLAGEG